MERIKVGWRDPSAHHAQSGVSELPVGIKFVPHDIHRRQITRGFASNITGAIGKMNCVRKERLAGYYKKKTDIRNLLTKENPPKIPKVCKTCHYAKINSNNVQSAGCIILDDYRDKLHILREGQEYSGPKTEIEVGLNGERKIKVPFSPEEIERLQKIRELHEIMGEGIGVSGIARQLYVAAKIPWGYALENRNLAIEQMKKVADVYKLTLEDWRYARSVAPLRETLTEINQGLQGFFEEN